MNFDFLEGLSGLGAVYKNCNNAEKLAMTMPEQSVITSRKSAELLAKFIYMTAHHQEIENLTFADILLDATFQKFVNSRDIINAFHYIRKSGNRVVHGDVEETAEDAVSVLQDLHYIAGETACKLELIDDYPEFDNHIVPFPDAKYSDDEDIDEKAREMFLSYLEELEQEQYIQIEDRDMHFMYTIEGNIEMHEYLKFDHKPRQIQVIEYLQDYLFTLLRLSVERSLEKAENHDPSRAVILDAKLTIGDKTYTSADLASFLAAINEELPKADEFIIDCKCDGILREFYSEEPNENGTERLNMIRKDAVWRGAGMFDTLLQYKRRDSFEYKLSAFYPDSGEFKYEKIFNGKEIDVLSTCTEEIVDRVFDEEWWSFSLNLCVFFDTDIYHDEFLKLQNLVRTSIPQSEVQYCESAWEDGDIHILCNGIQWDCKCLREIQNFLDKVNEILLPIKDVIEAGGDGTWEVRNEFAVATWDWTNEGFKVKGICY